MSKEKNFDMAKDLYLTAFPKEERRSFESIKALLEEDFFEFIPIYYRERFVGFITLWFFEDFAYVEHFAIEKHMRGKGLGTLFLRSIIENKILDTNLLFSLPNKKIDNIVLEVEKPENLEAKKRVDFYSHLGFVLLEDYYFQPPYTKETNGLEMKIMLRKTKKASSIAFNTIKDTLYQKVYAKK